MSSKTREKEKLKPLTVGEKKILEVLRDEPKKFSALSKVSGKGRNEDGILNPSILSKHLKNLQKNGFIKRDIDTLKYFLQDISIVNLFFNQMIEFMQHYLEETINEELSEGTNVLKLPEHVGSGWVALTEDSGFRKVILEDLRKDREIQKKLGEISNKIEDYWRSYHLSHDTARGQKIIETYRRYLLEIVKMLKLKDTKEQVLVRKGLQEKIEKEFQKSYPSVRIPKKMVQIELERRMKECEESDYRLWQPSNIEDLRKNVKLLEDLSLTRNDDGSEHEQKKLEIMGDFLLKHRKLYERYLSKRYEKCPKTLLIYPSWGFKDYLEKMSKLFPETQLPTPKIGMELLNNIIDKIYREIKIK